MLLTGRCRVCTSVWAVDGLSLCQSRASVWDDRWMSRQRQRRAAPRQTSDGFRCGVWQAECNELHKQHVGRRQGIKLLHFSCFLFHFLN